MDSWGCTTLDNYNSKVERTNKYKPLLLDMANFVQNILVEYKKVDPSFKWFLNDGSLLGAHRSGKMVKHDYDFDFGIYYTKDKMSKLSKFLEDRLGGTNYKSLIIDNYAHKIEVWDPAHGIHSTVAPRFFNVIMDLQLFTVDPEDNNSVMVQYFRINNKDNNRYKKEWFDNMRTIEFEKFEYPCVSDPESFLKVTYGYIGENAVFNKETGKYEKSK